MNLFTIAGLTLGVSCSLLALIVGIYGKQKLHRIWIFFNLSVAIWGFGAFMIGRAGGVAEARLAWRIAHIGGIFIPIFFFHTVSIFCNSHNKYRTLIRLTYFQGLFFLSINATNLFIHKLEFVFNSFFYTKAANFYYYLFFIIWAGLVFFGFFELLQYSKNAQGIKRNQSKYFFLGMLVGFSGGITNFLPMFGINVYPIGNFTIPIYCITVTYAILKFRLLDVRVFISRAAAFFLCYPIFLGFPFLFAFRLRGVLEGYLGDNWWLVPSGLLAFFATMAPIAYAQIRSKMESSLLSEQKQYQKLLNRAAAGMATEHDLAKLSKLIVYIIRRAVNIRFAAIFLDDKESAVYRLKAIRSSGETDFKGVSFLYEHPFIAHLRGRGEPFFFDELPESVKKWFTTFKGVSLVIPVSMDDNLLGFVFLGEKLNLQPYTDDDINVFKILSSQAALAIENCLFLDEFKHAQERIFTAEKLASIGGMADGVAHQIKNRLNQFSVASGELKYEIKDFIESHKDSVEGNGDLKKTFDYISSIADSLIKNVKKTDGIIKGILNFARVEEKETFFGTFALQEVIDLSRDLLRVKHEIAEVPLEVVFICEDAVYGVKSQITEAIYNVLDNCYEAMLEKRNCLPRDARDSYTPKMTLTLEDSFLNSLITISDNGIGIQKKDYHKIFAPFFTTKSSYKSGTGIGMYVVKRMVEENHKGKIWFESTFGAGTTIYIQLPKKVLSAKEAK